jgi:phospholipid-translocating ATPase
VDTSIFETHYKSSVVMGCFFLTTIGWWAWNGFLDGVFAWNPSGPYAIRDTFTHTWGRDATWWSTLFLTLSFLGLFEITLKGIKRNMVVTGVWSWPPWKADGLPENVGEWDLQIWQEMEQDPVIKQRLRRLAHDDEDDVDEEDEGDDDEGVPGQEAVPTGANVGKGGSLFQSFRKMIPLGAK